MAFTTVTYTFTNATVADATQVNQNFSDIINGTSDGTKDMSIAALTVAGAAALNGNVTLGNAVADVITWNGVLTGDIIPSADSTYDLGSSSGPVAFAEAYADTLYTDTINNVASDAPVRFPKGMYGYANADTQSLTDNSYATDDESMDVQQVTPNADERTMELGASGVVDGRHFTVINHSAYVLEVNADDASELGQVWPDQGQLYVANTLSAATSTEWDSVIPTVTDWMSTSTVDGSWSANYTAEMQYRRVGTNLEAFVFMSMSGGPGGDFYFNTPVIHGARINIDPQRAIAKALKTPLGYCVAEDDSGYIYHGIVTQEDTSTRLTCRYQYDRAAGVGFTSSEEQSNANPFTWAASDTLSIYMNFPVDEWTSTGLVP